MEPKHKEKQLIAWINGHMEKERELNDRQAQLLANAIEKSGFSYTVRDSIMIDQTEGGHLIITSVGHLITEAAQFCQAALIKSRSVLEQIPTDHLKEYGTALTKSLALNKQYQELEQLRIQEEQRRQREEREEENQRKNQPGKRKYPAR